MDFYAAILLMYYFLSSIATDYSGVPSSVTFTSTSQQQCFDVTYNTDTIYEATEGATLTANPGDSGLQPGNPISTVLEIRDSNSKEE